MNTRFLWVIFFCLTASISTAQEQIKWDDTSKNSWDERFSVVDIKSSTDGKIQKAYFLATQSKTAKPLIVSLHTWSGDYTQKDPLTADILIRDYNYIHPNFRGANRTPEACGSDLVISDIEDAISYALSHANVNPNEVHIIGTSGGGYATLLAYMNLKYPVKSFSAWAPISNLEDWYWESVGRKQKYAADILAATSTDSNPNINEMRRRSPMLQSFSADLRKGAKLYIYEGVHDGYTGSVPITHSINMYNHLAAKFEQVSDSEIISLLSKRYNPDYDKSKTIGGRAIYLQKESGGVSLTIFEGTHEQLDAQALSLLPVEERRDVRALKIFTIGDSNGANAGGWVDQLRVMLPFSDVFNISRGGRTIGFDNGGDKTQNAANNINTYIEQAQKNIGAGAYDYIVVCLGTNDTKAEFADQQEVVISNFAKILDTLKVSDLYRTTKNGLIVVSPPPMGTENIAAKYVGGNARLAALTPKMKMEAEKRGFKFVNIYDPLLPVFTTYAADGVHMSAAGQRVVAQYIIDNL